MDRKILAAAIVGGVSLALVPAVAALGAGNGTTETTNDVVGMMNGNGNGFGSTDSDDAGTDDSTGSDTSGNGTTDRDRDRDQDGTCDGLGTGDGTCDGTGTGTGGVGGMWGGRSSMGGMMRGDTDQTAALALVDGDISDTDAAALAYMVEEEKLAHDLYVQLGDEWDLRVFDMIAAAETQHESAVAALIDAYDLTDPTDGMAVGEFADPDLQDMYDTLLKQGLSSEEEALTVGALVEETDIVDLQSRVTDEDSVNLVFDNLETGSEHHLNAFVTNLERLGVTYDAQVLSDSELADILGD